MNMKNVLLTMVLVACIGSAMADRTALSWFTLGPDTYADGTCVKEGEFYALVFVKEGATFAGFNADGTLVDAEHAEILAMGPWAKKWTARGVGCPPHNIQPETAEAAKYAEGSLRLYVLDTRTPDGAPATTATDTSAPTAIHGYGEAANAKFELTGTRVYAESGRPAQAGLASAVPPRAAQPRITGIRVVDGCAYIKVAGTEPYLQYNVSVGSNPGDFRNGDAAEAPKQGDANQEIELKVPVSGKGRFFKVNRHGLATKSSSGREVK